MRSIVGGFVLVRSDDRAEGHADEFDLERIEAAIPAVEAFFFSSRRRHTRWTGDWSSDVCSSDLERVPQPHHAVARHRILEEGVVEERVAEDGGEREPGDERQHGAVAERARESGPAEPRSEERRVGKEWRS